MWGKLKSWRPRALRRYRGSEEGAAAVEFAMVCAPFFFLLGTICETGIMMFTEYVLQNATQQAARAVRTGQASTGSPSMTASAFKTLICNNVGVLIDCNGKVTVYVNNAADFGNLETTLGDPLDIGPDASGTADPLVFNPGAALQAATVVATYDWNFVFPFMDFLGNVNGDKARRVYGLAIFRNEPFGPLAP